MKKNILVLIILISVCFISCKKINKSDNENNISQNFPSVLNYLTALSTPVDMQFFLESGSSMLLQNNNNSNQLLLGSALNSSAEKVNIGALTFNGTDVTPSNNNYQKDFIFPNTFYGKNVIFKTALVSPPLASGYQFTDTLYAPNELSINPISVNQEIALNKIFATKNIKWNADLTNTTGGVIIVVEYIPQDILNAGIKSIYPTYVRNGMVVADNGNINLDESLFVGIPHNSSLLVTFIRANYKKGITTSLKTYLVCAYSKKYLNFTYQ